VSSPRRWLVNLTDEADADLKRLRKRHRKAWQEADAILDQLEEDPFIGDDCDPPLERVRREKFWNDRYRIAWLIIPEEQRVDVLSAGLKAHGRFYNVVSERLGASDGRP
jgi:mRNA-degrading endonuclease RelE of RelBE toxin-antitoxin system